MRAPVSATHRAFARSMRSNATDAESWLWQAIRAKRLCGFKFKRQVPIGGYIVDFVCFETKLIVEVDGSQHIGSPNDDARDAAFARHGFRTLRVDNDEVLDDVERVCRRILESLEGDRESTSPSLAKTKA